MRNKHTFAVLICSLFFTACFGPTDKDIAAKLKIPTETVKRIREVRGTVNRTLNELPESSVAAVTARLRYNNLPVQRLNYRKLQELSDNGSVRLDGMEIALVDLTALRSRVGARLRAAGIPIGRTASAAALIQPTAGLSPTNTGWTWLGPSNIGGRSRSLIVDPSNPNLLHSGSVGGGVWRSTDGGANWSPVDDLMANLVVSTLVRDPSAAKTIYAGTGEGYGNIDALRGAGIFRTTDDAVWTQLPATQGPNFELVNRLAISSDGKILLAATSTGIHRSADSARTSWSSVRSGDFLTVLFHPTDATKALAASRNGATLYTADGGLTWTMATHAEPWDGRVELAYAKKDPNIVYASVNRNFGEVWRSTDGGKSFSKRNTQDADGNPIGYLGEQGWYDNTLWAGDPTDADLLIVGGIDLWRSKDGGNKLVDISRWFEGESAHADHHAIVSSAGYNGTSNKTVYFANDGGLARTDDVKIVGSDEKRTLGWKRLSQSLGITQFYGGAVTSAGKLVGGAQDNGTLFLNPSDGHGGWSTMFGGDGGFVAADPVDPKVVYGEYVFLNLHRSLNEGKSAEYISGQFWDQLAQQWRFKQGAFRIPDAEDQSANFIAPFVIDSSNSNRILAGGMSLWQTMDSKAPNTRTSGPKWAAVKSPASVPISAITIAPGNSALVWVGHNNGDVFVSANSTAPNPSWKKMDDGTVKLPNRFCTRIVVDSTNSKIVYAAFGGFEKDNLWKTQNGGTTWTSVSNGLPKAPIRSVTIHPKRPAFLYLGTEVGVFASENGGASWSPTNEGPTSASVDELFWKGTTLYAATHGRGMYKISLPLP